MMSTASLTSILVVDDQPRNIVALEAALASIDCLLITANSGQDALGCVLRRDFAVILLDVHMPGMDGFETASLIRARERSRSTPIIFLTADDRAGARLLEGYRLGAVDYLLKPFVPDILRAKVTFFVELFRKTAALEQRTAELMLMAAELERSEDHFRALIENASDVILVVEANGVIRYAAPSIERTLGYSRDQITGRRVAELLHPDDVASLRSDIALFLKKGSGPPAGRRWRHANGSYRLLESTATNLLSAPSVAGVVVNARDVTERNRAEEQVRALNSELERRVSERTAALELAIGQLEREAAERERAEAALDETEQQLRTVVNNTSVVLFAVDGQGIFTLFEGRGLRALGMHSGQVVGQSALTPTKAVIGTSVGRGQLILSADVQRALDGETFTAVVEAFNRVFEVKYSPNLDSHGALVGAIGIAQDVSEQRALDRRKDAFVATMSHELRTPLNGIIGVSQLLLDSALDAAQLEYVEIIHGSGQALHRLIDDVLTLARYQSGKVTVDETDLDLQLIVEDVVALVLSEARHKGIDLVAHIDHTVPRGLRGDAGRLRQILLNLVGNAVKFTDTGSVLLQARVDDEDGERVSVRFEIRDTGIGIAPGVQARLFQPFEQADTSMTTRYGGTGLGLAICRQLVESMGGEIGLESAPARGSTFWFVLPLMRGKKAELVGRADLSDLRVLVTCDAPVRAAALRELIRAWTRFGTAVTGAAETVAAVNTAQANGEPTDAVVIDLDDAAGAGALLARSLARPLDQVGPHIILLAPLYQLEAVRTGAPGLTIISRPARSSQLFDALAKGCGSDNRHADSTAAMAAQLARPSGSGERILVVEDQPMNQLVARRVLEQLGYLPVVADSGRAALKLLDEAEFAIVLMDCRMPEMDGFEATRLIRQRESAHGLRRIPIVALTANAQERDRDNCLAAGMDDYVSKPLDMDDLARTLGRWTAGPANSILDRNALDRIRELQAPNATDLLTEVVEAFLTAAPTYLAQLTAALGRSDAEVLADAAHALKSGAGYLGAHELQRQCEELEDLGRSGVTAGGQVLAEQLHVVFEQTRVALAKELVLQDRQEGR